MSLLKFAKIYMFKYLKLSVFVIFLFFFTNKFLLSKEKDSVFGLLGSKQANFLEEDLTSELKIITREKSPLLIQNTQPIKQQFSNKVSIKLGGENGNLLYAKEVEEGSNLWIIDWIDQPEFKKPLGGINKNSNNYTANIYIENSFGDIKIIKLLIDVVKVVDINKKIEPESINLNSVVIGNNTMKYKKIVQDVGKPLKTSLSDDKEISVSGSKKRLLNQLPQLITELRIVTKENSPLLIENQLPIKQEFNDKVSISIEGEDGDLLYSKEDEENSNIWQIDWVNPPDFEKPMGGINNNSNNYKAIINVKDSFENIQKIKLFIDVVDMDENFETASKKSDPNNNIDENIMYTNSKISKSENKFFSLNELSLGLSEKGAYFGIAKDIGIKNQLEIGYNYLDLDISRFFKTNSQVKVKNSSLKFALRKFLSKKSNHEGLYFEGGGDLSKLDIYSDYSLTNQDSSFGSLSVSCSACGSLYVNLEDRYNLIPSILMGYRRKIAERLIFDLKAGVQYLNLPKFTWKAIQQDGSTYYPPFIYGRIQEEANSEVEILNNKLNDLPKLLPTVALNLIYRF